MTNDVSPGGVRPSSGGITTALRTLFQAWTSLWLLPFGAGPSRSDPRPQQLRADVRDLVALYEGMAGPEAMADLRRAVAALPSPETVCRALVAWSDFLETLIQEAEETHGVGHGTEKLQEVKASVLYVLEKSRFDLEGIPRFLQPLLFDAAVDWSCEWIVHLLNRQQLWETHAPSPAMRLGPSRSLVLKTETWLNRFSDQLYALAWWLTRARHPLRPALRARLDRLVEDLPIEPESLLRSTISAMEWMGRHRPQITAFADVVMRAVREAESFATMSGREKKQYVRDLVLAFLDETGILPIKSQISYGFTAILLDASIDAVVHIFNKRFLFQHSDHSGEGRSGNSDSQTAIRQLPPAPLVSSARRANMTNNPRIAFIISGAGALIAQELALAKTLLNGLQPGGFAIRPAVLTGASSGCLSSVLISGILQAADRGGSFTWDVLQNEILFPLQNRDIYKTGFVQGIFDMKHAFWDGYVLDTTPLQKTLEKYIGGKKYLNYHILGDVYIPTYISSITRRSGVTKRFFSGNAADARLDLVQLMLASTAIPVAFPQRTIDAVEGTWVDGSVGSDLIPVAPLVNQEPFDEVYVISPQFRMPDASTDYWGKGMSGRRSLLKNMLFGLEVQFTSMLDMQLFAALSIVKETGKAFLYRPDIPQSFGFLDFGVMEKQFNATLDWARANAPIPIEQYLVAIQLIPPNSAMATALRKGATRLVKAPR
jgi:predicted acylesterase/phospholipase RssA